MTTQDLLEKLYGVRLYKNTQVLNDTVGTTATPIVSNDPGAVFILVDNLGTSDVVFDTDPGVTTTKGTLLAAQGGNMSWNAMQHFLMPTEAWYAIGVTGTSPIRVTRYSILESPAGK